ncbi:hypothetical protein Q8W13_12590 [Photobacterium damselae subsp. piscicida]|nr:hypothetical protein [Photobacterium damselae subsp. piscicida]
MAGEPLYFGREGSTYVNGYFSRNEHKSITLVLLRRRHPMINRVCFKKVDKAIALSQYPQAAHQAQLERFLLHLISPPTQLTPNTRYFSENGEVKSGPWWCYVTYWLGVSKSDIGALRILSCFPRLHILVKHFRILDTLQVMSGELN